MSNPQYDVVIVGAGIAGSALAHALSSIGPRRERPLKIALLERSLAKPDRIVGELLQPGGANALKELGLAACLEGIGAIPVHGYCIIESGRNVRIPYTGSNEGRSFHHGEFVMSLRAAAHRASGVDVIEATVTDLIEKQGTQQVVGVRARVRKETSGGGGESSEKAEDEVKEFRASLVVIADGCASNFRSKVMGKEGATPVTNSHFVGAILKDTELPIPQHGTVALVKKGFGPVLLYQISKHDTRMLIDVKVPLPADLKSHILTNIVPQLPSSLHIPIQNALSSDRIRRMPNSFLPPIKQGSRSTKSGVILVGDAWNMRHPLTGGGMTVALHDVVMLRDMLADVRDLGDASEIRELLGKWHWSRKPLASMINILSFALYDLFGADDEKLEVLRTGCFKYFELGGECVDGPVSLLSGVAPSPALLAWHFFSVAFYSIWVMFTHPMPVKQLSSGFADKPVYAVARPHQYPSLFIKSIRVVSVPSPRPPLCLASPDDC
ncbi:hypothetical protein HGRIS_010310 [Hohenbuehelia grisea]|uniref:Squalene monooxygenase n=1 Tax=Hohenbuehelia grisea TaxID=104357 RepID=A0ABR3J4F1_9AGAR